MTPSIHAREMPIPPSPTLSARTTATTLGVSLSRLPPILVNRSDLRDSLSAYEALLSASKGYTQALLSLSSASSDLACALQTCSRLKGAHEVGSGLLAASGVHHMASNSLTILADTWWKETAIPLLEHHDMYVQACTERSITHEKAILQKSRELNEAEKRNRKGSKTKQGRDLVSFRKALNELQKRVDELDDEKIRYYSEVLEGEEECWDFIQGKVMTSLRSQLDVYERISSKGLSDATLEPLLSSIPDPFSAYGPPRNDEQIFSILGPNNLTSVAPSPDPSHNPSIDGVAISSSDVMNQLIMSPSTPAKGLSRVTSGATSPVNEEISGGPSTSSLNGGGLGISLTAAATIALQDNTANAANPKMVSGNADLFGTDGEDDGGDEASIFSGTEDEGAPSMLQKQNSTNGTVNVVPGTTAEKLIKEKKKRKERAGRANAKNRLKNSLSIIDESKGGSINRGALEARDTNVDIGGDRTAHLEADKGLSADEATASQSWW